MVMTIIGQVVEEEWSTQLGQVVMEEKVAAEEEPKLWQEVQEVLVILMV
jgi:hypothetical protein